MFGFGSLGQFSLGEIGGVNVNFTVGAAAATGQATAISGKVSSFTFSGVAGSGVVGTITQRPSGNPLQASGIGAAGTLNSFNVTLTINAASGIGQAGSVISRVAVGIAGAAGVGAAGQIGNVESVTVAGVAGTGIARSATPALAIAIPGVAGTGTAGILGRFDIALTVPAATSVGTAGSVNIGGSVPLFGAVGAGVTNWSRSQPSTLYRFVDLVHFDAYPVQYTPDAVVPDMTKVSVVLPSAVGGGVVGEIRPKVSGGSGHGHDHDHHHKGRRAGLEPVKKLPPAAPVVADRRPVPLPPYRSAPALVPETSPLDLVDRSLIPTDLLGLQDQIHTAQDIADIQRFLLTLEQDEQDAADIADVLSILDQELA